MLEQRIKATFGQYQVPAVVHAVQGDTGRVFIFESQDRQITGTETAALMCIRPDGTAFSYAGTVDPDLNEITVALNIDGGALSQAGVVAAQLVMQEDGQVLCSFKLGIIVEEALGGEATPEEISFLDGLQAQLDAWIAGAQSRFVTSSRKVNGKALTQDITITASDVPYDNTDSGLTADDVQESVDELALKEAQLESTKANKSTTINGKSLEENRVIYAQDIPSKNLLPNNASTTTTNGVTFTVNADGSISTSGTASAGVEFFIYANGYWSPSPYPFDKSNQYILSGCPTGGTDSSYSLRIYEYNGSSSTGNYKDYGSGVTFTPNASGTGCLVMIAIQSGTNMNGKVFRPMIRLASIEDDSYVPYAKTNVELSQGSAGSNYTRLPDGTQICWGRVNLAVTFTNTWGQIFYGDVDNPVTFPVPFVSTPSISVAHGGSGSSFSPMTIKASATAITQIQLARGTAVSGETSVQWLAVGKWK